MKIINSICCICDDKWHNSNNLLPLNFILEWKSICFSLFLYVYYLAEFGKLIFMVLCQNRS